MALPIYLSPVEGSGGTVTLMQDPIMMEAQKHYLQFLQTKPSDVSPQAFRQHLFDIAAKTGDDSLKQNAEKYANKLLFRPSVSTAQSGSLMGALSTDKNGQQLTLWERLSRSYANFMGPNGAIIIGGPDPASAGASELSSLVGYIDLYKSARNKYENTALGVMDKNLAEAEMNKAAGSLLTLVGQNQVARASAQGLLAGARLGLLEASTQRDEKTQALAYSDMQLDDRSIMDLLAMGLSNARTYAASAGEQTLEVSQKINMNTFVVNPDSYSPERSMVEVKSLARGYDIHYEVLPDRDYRPFANMQLASIFSSMALKQGFDESEADVIGQIKGTRPAGRNSTLSIKDYIVKSKAYNELCPESKGAYTNPDEVSRFMGYFGQNSMLYVVLASLQVSDRNGAIDLKSVKIITDAYGIEKAKSGETRALDAAKTVARELGVDFGPNTEKALGEYTKLLAQPLVSLSEATHERALPSTSEVSGGSGEQNSPLKLRFGGLDPSYCLVQTELYKQLYPDVQKFFNGEEGDQSKKEAVSDALSPLGWSRADTDKLVDGANVPIEGGLWWAYNQKPGQPSLGIYGGVSYNQVIRTILEDMRAMETMLANEPGAKFTSFLKDSLKRTDQDLEVLSATNPELDNLTLRDVFNSYQNVMKALIGERQANGDYSGGILSYARVAPEQKYVSYPGIPQTDASGNPIYTEQDPQSGLYHGVKTKTLTTEAEVPRQLSKESSGQYTEFGSDFFYIADDEKASQWWSNTLLPSRRLTDAALATLVRNGFLGDVRSGANWENFMHPLTLRLKLQRNFGDGIKGAGNLHAQLPTPTIDTQAGQIVDLPVNVYLEGPKDAAGQPSFVRPYTQNPDLALRYAVFNPADGKTIVGKEVAASSGTPLTFDTSLMPAPDFASVSSFTSVGPATYVGETTPANSDWVFYKFGFAPTFKQDLPYVVQPVHKDPDQPLYTGTPYSIPLDHAYSSILSPANPKELNTQGIVRIEATYPAEFVLAVRNAGGLLPMLLDYGSYEIYWAGNVTLSSHIVKDPVTGLIDSDKSKALATLKLTGGSSRTEAEVTLNGKPDNTIVLMRNLPVRIGTISYFRDELDYFTHERLGERFYLTRPVLNESDLRNIKLPPAVVAEAAPLLRSRDLEGAVAELSKRGVSVKNETQLSNRGGDLINTWKLETEPVSMPFPPPGGAEKGTTYFVRLNVESGQYEVFRSRVVELPSPSTGRLQLKAIPSEVSPERRDLVDEFLDPSDPSRVFRLKVGEARRPADGFWVPAPVLFSLDTRGEFLPSVLYHPDKLMQDELERRYGHILSTKSEYRTNADAGLPAYPFQNTTADRISVKATPDWWSAEVQDFVSKLLSDLYQYKLIRPDMDPNKAGIGLELKLSDHNLIDPFSQTLFENVQFSGGLLDTPSTVVKTNALAAPAYRPYMAPTSAPAPTTAPAPKTKTTTPSTTAPRQKTKSPVIPVPKIRRKAKAPVKKTDQKTVPQAGSKPVQKPGKKPGKPR